MKNKIDQDSTEYWDRVYSGEPYQDRIKNDRELWLKFLDESIDHSKPLKILEFGCGVGDYCAYLKGKGHDVVGYDYSPESIKQCKKRYPKGNFAVKDIREFMEFQKWDVIIAFEVIEHLKNPDPVLFWLRKAIKPEGQFIFSLPHKDGRFGVFPEHFTLWNHNIISEVFGKFWSVISFHKVHAMCNGTNIFGTAKQVKKW